MTVSIDSLSPDALEVSIDDKLEDRDYIEFVPMAEERIERFGHLNLLLDIHHFGGWTPSALWEDLKFDDSHYSDVSRLAVVGDDESRQWMATVSKPFTAAEVQFFPRREIDRARRWVVEPTRH